MCEYKLWPGLKHRQPRRWSQSGYGVKLWDVQTLGRPNVLSLRKHSRADVPLRRRVLCRIFNALCAGHNAVRYLKTSASLRLEVMVGLFLYNLCNILGALPAARSERIARLLACSVQLVKLKLVSP